MGTGYVGTVVAAGLAAVGRTVVGLEEDKQKLAALRSGSAPFFEAGLDELLASGMATGNLSFTGDPRRALGSSDVVFLCVGTPPGAGGRPDMTAVESAARVVGQASRCGHVVVTKSTVPVGSGRWISNILESAGAAPAVVSNPEFLREGSAVGDFLRPDRIVLGSDDHRALDLVTDVYAPILNQQVPNPDLTRRPSLVRTDLATAETIKYAANAFLATKISFINEIATICEMVGADVGDVAAAMGLDFRIGPAFLDAGIGWGGSCFGKDLAALIATAEDHGYQAPLLRASVAVNQRQRRVVIEKLQRSLGIIRGRRICLLGLAFKPGTDDLRDSPAVDVARRLVDLGAVVTAYDPLVATVPEVPELRISADAYSAAERADATVLVTDWPEFLQLDLGRLSDVMRGRTFVDARNMLDPSWVEDASLAYEGIGRQIVHPRTSVRL